MAVTEPDDPKTPLDHTLDVFVYLPVGFLLELPRSIPRYIDRGRRQLDPSRLLASRPTSTFDRLHAHTHNTLRALGVVADDGPVTAPAGAATNGSGPVPLSVVGDAPATTAGSSEVRAEPVSSGIDPDTLAITDYDSLSASQVVPRLDSLGPDELESIRLYEVGSRGRKTILNKIAQLQAS